MKYAGEIHFVHMNPETSESAVLSIFMQSNRTTTTNKIIHAQKRDNNIYKTTKTTIDEWKKYFSVSKYLHDRNNSTILNLNLASLMGDSLNDFWRYKGSLTTPPCTEDIIWSIFKTPIIFNDSDIDTFRENILYEGYRGPQPLYNRIVYRNFLNETLSSIADNYCCSKGSNNSGNKLLFLIIDIIFLCFLIL
jgi:carbonic anhydrase